MRTTSLAIAISALLCAGINTNVWAEASTMDDVKIQKESMDENEPSHPTTMPNRELEMDLVTQPKEMFKKSDIQPDMYLNKEIITSKGESIGTIEQLVISKENKSVYAISGLGGFMGIGEKVVAIPLDQLRSQGDKFILSSGITEDSLKQEQEYEKSEFSAFEVKEKSSKY